MRPRMSLPMLRSSGAPGVSVNRRATFLSLRQPLRGAADVWRSSAVGLAYGAAAVLRVARSAVTAGAAFTSTDALTSGAALSRSKFPNDAISASSRCVGGPVDLCAKLWPLRQWLCAVHFSHGLRATDALQRTVLCLPVWRTTGATDERVTKNVLVFYIFFLRNSNNYNANGEHTICVFFGHGSLLKWSIGWDNTQRCESRINTQHSDRLCVARMCMV